MRGKAHWTVISPRCWVSSSNRSVTAWIELLIASIKGVSAPRSLPDHDALMEKYLWRTTTRSSRRTVLPVWNSLSVAVWPASRRSARGMTRMSIVHRETSITPNLNTLLA